MVGVAFVDGQVDHQPVRCGAVPVILVGLEQHAVAGPDDLDRSAAALAQTDPFGDEDGLASGWRCQWVRAPGMKCTRLAVTRDGAGAAATTSM
ncbi:MAG: hypothetical protein ABIS86_23715 [Streptosporangiaceae bacterium]